MSDLGSPAVAVPGVALRSFTPLLPQVSSPTETALSLMSAVAGPLAEITLGLPVDPLPPAPGPRDPSVPHAPKRNVPLSPAEVRVRGVVLHTDAVQPVVPPPSCHPRSRRLPPSPPCPSATIAHSASADWTVLHVSAARSDYCCIRVNPFPLPGPVPAS